MQKEQELIGRLRSAYRLADFVQTGAGKALYLDIMEKVLAAYPVQELEQRVRRFEPAIVEDIQAFSRITSLLGLLIANGRKSACLPLWRRMMALCCRDISKYGEGGVDEFARPDFSVKELMLVYKAMKPWVEEKEWKKWEDGLKKVDPDVNYLITRKRYKGEISNINVYSMAGEFLRQTEGMTDCTPYFDAHWPLQLKRFDENGMYRDPDEPMLYDLTTRVQMQYITGFGYRGPYFAAMDEAMRSGALCGLFFQSSAFTFPYGGRSNQYQFNEALLASCGEYEARRYQKQGDLKTAGAFKRSAHLAALSIMRWLDDTEFPRHIKNFYPIDSKIGTEPYGYYDKYMATLGTFIYPAFYFADDAILEEPCPAETGGFIMETSDAFHKVFANCREYCTETDYRADFHYDSHGLGRIQKKGAPVELALSGPFTATASYQIPAAAHLADVSLCAGWRLADGSLRFLSSRENRWETKLQKTMETSQEVAYTLTYRLKGADQVEEQVHIDETGVEVVSRLCAPDLQRIYFQVPVFITNGKEKSVVTQEGNRILVDFLGWRYTIATDGAWERETVCLQNRNGEYQRYVAWRNQGQITLHFSLEKIE